MNDKSTIRANEKALRDALLRLRSNNKLQALVANALATIDLQISIGCRRNVHCGFSAGGCVIGVYTFPRLTGPRPAQSANLRDCPYGFGIARYSATTARVTGHTWGPSWRHMFKGSVVHGDFASERWGTFYLDANTGKYRALHELPETSPQ